MKILLIGSGGREHAIAAALHRENTSIDLIAAPGNPGIADLARLSSLPATEIRGLGELAEREVVDLVIVGPEAPLAAGIVDHLRQMRIPVFGPTRDAAKLETSKADTKAMMLTAGIPTAHAETHRIAATAREAVRLRFGAPVVIKASGLASGKGVFVCTTLREADQAIERILGDRAFGDAGNECLVEQYMTGEELSLFAVTDGTNVLPMIAAQDHKRLLAGDDGPNTGGMGAYTPVSLATPALMDDITERILLPTLHAMRKRDAAFTGLLYAGVMLTEEGPKVVEFNCRFGDPETQAVLPMLASSLLDPMLAVANGAKIGGMSPFTWHTGAAVTTVVAAAGYPDAPETGERIHLPSFADDISVFHAGTTRAPDGALLTSGGRVVAVTARASTFAEAQRNSREAAARVEFGGAFFRPDIGWREAIRQDTAHIALTDALHAQAREQGAGAS